MSLPPAEKLSIAVRKSLRDSFESKREELEKSVSDALGETWKIEVNPNAIWPYATEGYSKENLGGLIYEYFDTASRRLNERDDYTKEAINKTAPEHIITLEAKPDADFPYSSSEFRDGKLVLQFKPESISSNIGRAAEEDEILRALNRADKSTPISFKARWNIHKYYEPKLDDAKKKIETALGKPLKLNPNFEENFAKLSAYAAKPKTKIHDNWEGNFGAFHRGYFEGLASQLDWQKFEDDDLLQEGFFEAVSDEEAVITIVDQLAPGKNYCDSVIENGKLYIRILPNEFAVNIDGACENLVDKL